MSFAVWNPVRATALLVVAALIWSGSAGAQSEELTEPTLKQPWEQHLAVLQSLSDSIRAVSDEQPRGKLADALATLQVALGEYENQCDTVIDRIIGDPAFAYAAAETSGALSAQLAEVHARFEALYTILGVQEREDVRKAQASLDSLRKVLGGKMAFERDVINALGSLSKPKIVGLATSWWNGEERAIAVKKLIASLRQDLDDIPAKKEQG